MKWVFLIGLALAINVVFVLYSREARFWRAAGKQPDRVYEMIRASEDWVVLDDGLPANLRDTWPKNQWTGPFRLDVPKLGRRVYFLGRHPQYKESAARILETLNSGSTN